MKDALVNKAKVNFDNIIVEAPDIKMNEIGKFIDNIENRKRFFYPATAFSYKNHITLLKGINYAVKNGMTDYEVIFTIKSDENLYTQMLYRYAKDNHLNVLFNGPISRKNVFNMYTESILIFPSFVESFGLPLLEARMSSTYVLASNCPFCREILAGYNKTMFFNPLDYEKLGKLILSISN